MLELEQREIFARDYSASVLGMIGKMLGMESWTLKSYVDMAYPETVTDTRSADEIKKEIVKRLTA